MKCYAPASVPAESEPRVGARRQCIDDCQDAALRPAAVSLSQMKARINERVDVQEYHENCRDRGLFYGAYPRILVSELYRNDQESLGWVLAGFRGSALVAGKQRAGCPCSGRFPGSWGALRKRASTRFSLPSQPGRYFEPPGKAGWCM